MSHGRDSQGYYRGPLRKVHRPRGRESLAVRCLRDGTLDVCLLTGHVFSSARGASRSIKTRTDEDGYEKFTLHREATGRERRKCDGSGRRRLVMEVFVHRLVMLKKLAVARGESRWREHVEDLPGDRDVHHRDTCRSHNAASNLTLELIPLNRGRSPVLEEF
jgi:hypothetical protein